MRPGEKLWAINKADERGFVWPSPGYKDVTMSYGAIREGDCHSSASNKISGAIKLQFGCREFGDLEVEFAEAVCN
jgi:hypothetical protein